MGLQAKKICNSKKKKKKKKKKKGAAKEKLDPFMSS